MWIDMGRHLELYEARGEPHTLCDGKVFRPYGGGAVRPYGPAKFDYTITREQALEVLSQLGGRVLLGTDGFREDGVGDWYAVICSKFITLEMRKSKYRSEVRRGLANCEVRRINAEELIGEGYGVYTRALERYRGSAKPTWDEKQFRRHVHVSGRFDDIVHFWGAFHGGRLVAFAICNVFDAIEATYWIEKVDPASLPHYPAYALQYEIGRYYLDERKFEYINAGWRSIIHSTGIQDFLIRKFGFRRAHSGLQVTYGRWLAAVVACAYPFRKLVGQASRQAGALLSIEEVRRSSRHASR